VILPGLGGLRFLVSLFLCVFASLRLCVFVTVRPRLRRSAWVTLLPCALRAELCSPQNVGVRANSPAAQTARGPDPTFFRAAELAAQGITQALRRSRGLVLG
jgi:hypothetical protein